MRCGKYNKMTGDSQHNNKEELDFSAIAHTSIMFSGIGNF